MKDRVRVLAEALFATMVFLIGAGAGAGIYSRTWMDDCERAGQHIEGSKVYTCSVEPQHGQRRKMM